MQIITEWSARRSAAAITVKGKFEGSDVTLAGVSVIEPRDGKVIATIDPIRDAASGVALGESVEFELAL